MRIEKSTPTSWAEKMVVVVALAGPGWPAPADGRSTPRELGEGWSGELLFAPLCGARPRARSFLSGNPLPLSSLSLMLRQCRLLKAEAVV